MFRTLVVPLDGSALAERALPYAIQLAQAGRGKLILMRAAMAAPPRSLDGSEWEGDQAEAIAEAEQYLSEITERVTGQVSEVETVAAYGRAPAEILETAARFEADGIVMATHGRTGFAHLLYGSVTEAVLASSELPVFVVYARPGEQPPPPFSPAAARVLVPQDFSRYDAPAVNAALQVLGERGQVILVTVIPPPERIQRDEFGHVIAYLDQQEESDRLLARDYLSQIAAGLRDRPVPIDVKVDVRIGDAASGIVMAAIENSADLIVMATHGRTGIRRAVLGSVAGTVLRMGSTPVLLAHPRTPYTEAQPEQVKVEEHVPLVTF